MKTLPSLAELAAQFSSAVMHLQPPAVLIEEVQDRLLLLVNHVLMQEPAAIARLIRQQNRTLQISWRQLQLSCRITPAGLFERTVVQNSPHLSLHISQESPWAIFQGLAQGDKPTMQVQGDVMLAADINWLVDHVRWDIEEDLSRVLGDAMAHQSVAMAKRIITALKGFLPSSVSPMQSNYASSNTVHPS
jgi:ubiquinone biosynthesis protein UbiJ